MKQEYESRVSFSEYFSQTRIEIEKDLTKFISTLSNLEHYPKIQYAVLSEGKRFRPFLTILAAESVGGKKSEVLPLAMAFELMHTSTLVHDDIIDQDENRRGKPSVYKKWSVNEAILLGDVLIALSISLAAPFGETVLKNVAQSAVELCEGEYRDLSDSLETTTEQVYFKKIKEKSASLCRAAAYSGAIAGRATPLEAQALADFGENFGVAYQLRDDILDFQSQNLKLKDLSEGKITLPIIYCYSHSSASEKKQIRKIQKLLKEPSKAYQQADELLQLIHGKGGFEYCEKKIDHYLSSALSSISLLKETPNKAYLVDMIITLRTWNRE